VYLNQFWGKNKVLQAVQGIIDQQTYVDLNVSRHFYFVKYQIFSTNPFLKEQQFLFKIWDSDSNLIRTNLTKNVKIFGFG
jgi:hypothetical protein